MTAIIGRAGERIVPEEYPPEWWAKVGSKLDQIAAESDDVHTVEATS